jgi:hypothetical protein
MRTRQTIINEIETLESQLTNENHIEIDSAIRSLLIELYYTK